MEVPVNVTNGTIEGRVTTVTIPPGSVESDPLTVTRTPGATGAVTADIGTLPGLPPNHSGYAHVKSADLPLTVVDPTTTTTGSDLVVGSPSVSDDSPVTGAVFTLSVTVRNGGDGAAAATTLRYYRSADATITTSDTAAGTDAVGALSASGTSAESIDKTAPPSAGTYYYGACVDAVADESDITNNCSTSVQVTVLDEPTPTMLTLSAASTPAEGGNPVTVTATLDNPAPANGLTVTLTTSGTATLDTDYTLSSTTITLAEGETAGTVTITVTDDAEDDAGETIVIDAESTSPALTAEPLTLTIEDNDVTPVPALPLGGAMLLGLLLTLLGAVRMRMRTDIARGC